MIAYKKNLRADGPLEPVPGMHLRHSFHLSRANRSDSLPSIAGVSLALPDAKSMTSLVFSKTSKAVPNAFKMERKPRKSFVNKSVQVSCDEKGIFLSKLEALEKENLLLRSSVKEYEDMVTELNKTITYKTLQFSRDLELEQISHKATKESLHTSQRLVSEKEQLLEKSILHYEAVIRELQSQYEDSIKALRDQSQTEIDVRDEKINKLKHQISELFKDKSWEHQKQIEEFQKDVSRLADEALTLRMKLKRDIISKQECEKCKSLMAALEDSRVQLRMKNRTVEELQSLCQRFQNQLQQQTKLQNLNVQKTKKDVN